LSVTQSLKGFQTLSDIKIKTIKKMSKPSFDEIYMELAENLALRSHCIKAKVGAVLTRDTRIISLGYNGPPAGTHNCDEVWPDDGCPRDSKGSCSLALHAEQNAILFAAKSNTSIEGATLYVTLSPCISCARVIFTIGIKKVYYLNSYADFKGLPTDEGVDFLRKFGVEVVQYHKKIEV
jgi:dCMP deaminase